MFDVLVSTIEWIPLVLRIPILALVVLLSLVVVFKLASAVMSIISAVLSFITSWW